MRHQTSLFTLGETAPFMELGETEQSERKLGVGGEAKRGEARRGGLLSTPAASVLHVNHLQCVRNLRGLLILQVSMTSHCVLIACLLDDNAFTMVFICADCLPVVLL